MNCSLAARLKSKHIPFFARLPFRCLSERSTISSCCASVCIFPVSFKSRFALLLGIWSLLLVCFCPSCSMQGLAGCSACEPHQRPAMKLLFATVSKGWQWVCVMVWECSLALFRPSHGPCCCMAWPGDGGTRGPLQY